jgi:hypothetical protein
MKRFLAHLVPFLAIQLVIAAGFLALYRPSPRHILAATIDKHHLLATTPGPRLVLIGGSSLPFSMDCAILAQRLPLHPIDTGLHAGLGIGFTLNDVRRELRPGDVAVLSIEYEQFGITGQPEIVLRLLSSSPGSVRYVPADYWPALLDYGFSYAGIVVRNVVESMRGRPEPLNPPYLRDALNAFGDDTLRTPAPHPPPVELAIFPDGRLPRRFNGGVDRINAFADECRARGVHVYFTHPALPESRRRLHGGEIALAEAAFRKRLRVPLLEQADDVVLPDRLFYDTEYHLKHEGVGIRTQMLAAALAARLKADAVPLVGESR